MIKAKKDIEKNRLYVSISGMLSVEEAKKARDLIAQEIKQLQPNFDLINDISKFIRGEEETGIILQQIMIILNEKKVGRVVRVIGTSKTGLLQFAKYSLPIESYNLTHLPTLEEAEEFLDKKD